MFITNQGFISYNLDKDGVNEASLARCDESRIEVISERFSETLEADLMACLID